MEIKIKIEDLESHALTVSQYCWMYLYNIGNIQQAWRLTPLMPEEFELLEVNKYLTVQNSESETGYTLLDKAKNLFSTSSLDESWKEFKLLYPKKSGERGLHDSQEKCKQKLFNYLKQGLKEDIFKGLKNEILARETAKRRQTFFQEWKLMSTWLNNQSWTSYLDYKTQDINQDYKTI